MRTEALHRLSPLHRSGIKLIFASLLATVLVHFVFFRKRGILDPVSVFLISYLYYSYFIPVSMVLFEQFDLNLLPEVSWISNDKDTFLWFFARSECEEKE